jgi:DNA-directed RNA polymerase subunit RPC12/RpoP
MIYTCPVCGAPFKPDAMRNAIKNNETEIFCNYCGNYVHFRDIKSSHIAKGYDYLALGDFYRAQLSFTASIDDSRHRHQTPSPDAYIGNALAQFRVQTITSDEDEPTQRPMLICHQCNELDFYDSEYFNNALLSLDSVMEEDDVRSQEREKLFYYANYIDKIREHYQAIAREKGTDFSYGVFIAYEDKPEDGATNRGYEIAHKVRNALPGSVKNVFLPDIDDYDGDELRYEAEILYALDHSNCMLVITDNDIDTRLTNMYSRFYFNGRIHGGRNGQGGKNLGFVRYCGHITIALPDRTIADKNVFDLERKDDYIKFVCTHNGVVFGGDLGGFTSNNTKTEVGKEIAVTTIIDDEEEYAAFDDEDDTHPYRRLQGRRYQFGQYPQKRDTRECITDYFAQFPKPTFTDDNGWTVMFVNKLGKPYTWYRDEVIDGKKYRGVYFMKFRDVYSVQKSDIQPKEQRGHGYMPMRVHCFAFEPLVWETEDMSNEIAVLVANRGIDSRAFNDCEMDNNWDSSTIKEWLNNDFLYTAFNDEEQKNLCTLDGKDEYEKVFLMDKVFDKSYRKNKKGAILSSDYFKCIGGMGDRAISSYWITDKDVDGSKKEATVIYPGTEQGLASKYVDCTLVAVLPKIILKL